MPGAAGLQENNDRTTPDLDMKILPRRARGQDTYEFILETAGTMLGRVGFEQLTTNLICKEAGMTPPALYRYFPNKYAILKVLGERLIDAQDAVVADWLASGALDERDFDAAVDRIASLQRGIIAVTMAFPGGIAVNRAIRAVPILQKLHIASRETVAAQLFDILRPRLPMVPEVRIRAATRMVSELSAALMEMIIDDPQQDNDPIIYEMAFLFASYFRTLQQMPFGTPPDRAK
jgi:AcrR family transcriptional regulator